MSTEDDGRAQTPELTTEQIVRRHHLDVTTPNRHGLLLASPPHRGNTSFVQSTPPKQTTQQISVRNNTGELLIHILVHTSKTCV